MADTEPQVAAAASASAAAQTPEPVVAQAAPAPVETPEVKAEPAAPVEAKEPERQLTLLEKFDAEQKPEAKAEEKPAEVKVEAKPEEKKDEKAEKPAEAAKPAETPEKKAEAEKPAEAAKPEPVEYVYTLPETLKMDDALKGEVHQALDQFRADPSKGVQGLIDLHNKQMTSYAQEVARNQVKVWNDTRKGWQTDVLADNELGGAGHQTAMGAIARMRDLFVSEKDRPEFETFLQVTGAGDHPAFLRMLHKAARYFDEAPLPPPNPKPVAGNGQRAPSRLRDIYGRSGGAR